MKPQQIGGESVNKDSSLFPGMTNIDKHIQPDESLTIINSWKLWLAFETVTQLKSAQPVDQTIENLCSDILIDQNVFKPIFESFSKKLNSLVDESDSPEDWYMSLLELEKFYTTIIFREFNKLEQELKILKNSKLQECLFHDVKQASPENLISFLDEFVEILFQLRENFEEQRISNLAIQKSASRALNNLNILSSSEDSKWNAIALVFNSKLQIQVTSVCSQIYFALIQTCQSYQEYSRRSSALLDSVAFSLEKQSSLDMTTFPIFSKLKRLDLIAQRDLIVKWIGHSINYWSSSSVSPQQLETQILKNIDESARQLYFDHQLCISEHDVS